LEQARARNDALGKPTLETNPETHERVRPDDCGPLGQLTPPRCLELVLAARAVHWQRFYGLDLGALQRQRKATWIAREQRLVMVRPARALEEVRVRTRLLDFDPTTALVEALVVDAPGRVLKALARVSYAWTHVETGRPEPHPEDITAILGRIRVGGEGIEEPWAVRRPEAVQKELVG
jgi:acyl-CoA thioesterase FadM